MPQPGMIDTPPLAEGQMALNRLGEAGFSNDEILGYKAQTSDKLRQAGFNDDEINSYWGAQTPDHSQDIANMARHAEMIHWADKDKRGSFDTLAALNAGFQNSVVGLMVRGKAPDQYQSQVSDLTPGSPAAANARGLQIAEKAMIGAGQMVGDLPASIGGAVAGAAAGAALTAEGGPMAAVGVTVGAGVGSTAVPEAIRQGLITAYRTNKETTASEFINNVGSGFLETMKAGAAGAVGGVAGKAVGAAVGSIGAPRVIAGLSDVVANASAFSTASAAMNGKLPDADEFIVGAILGVGAAGAGAMVHGVFKPTEATNRVKTNLEGAFAQTGAKPGDIIGSKDRMTRSEVFQQDANGDPVIPSIRTQMLNRQPEPASPPDYSGRMEINPDPKDQQPLFKTAGDIAPLIRTVTGDNVPAGTLRHIGMDPADIKTPEDRKAASDLAVEHMFRQFGSDPVKTMVGYLEGPYRVSEWANGKMDPADLPPSTAAALENAGFHYSETAGKFFYVNPNREIRTAGGALPVDPGKEVVGWMGDQIRKLGEMLNVHYIVNTGGLDKSKNGPGYYAARGDKTSSIALPDSAEMDYAYRYGVSRNEVAYHELGHAIDHRVSGGAASLVVKKSPELQAEMSRVNRMAFPKLYAMGEEYRSKPHELFADSVAVWLSHPDLRAEMPLFAEKFGKLLKPYLDVVSQQLPVRTGKVTGEKFVPDETQDAGWASLSKDIVDSARTARGLPAISEEAANAGGGGAEPPAIPPQAGGKGIGEPRGDLPHLSEQDINDIFNQKIKAAPVQKGDGLSLSKFYDKFISELGPFKRLDKYLEEAHVLDRRTQPGLEDAFRMTYTSGDTAGDFVNRGIYDPITRERVSDDSLQKAVKSAEKNGGDANGFRNYLLAKRTLAKTEQGFETGFDPALSKHLVEMGKDKYGEAEAIWNRVMDGVLQYGRNSGVFNDAQIEAMSKMNPTYITMRRLTGDVSPLGKAGRGFNVRNPVKRFEGSDADIVDPILASIDNIHQIVKMADRNRATGQIVGLAERFGKDIGLTQLEHTQTIFLYEPGSKDGIPLVDGKPVDPQQNAPFLAARAVRKGQVKADQFVYIRNGVPELWRATDPDLATAVRGAEHPIESNIVMDAMSFTTRMLQGALVLDPSFEARRWMRDTLIPSIMAPHNIVPFFSAVRGMKEMMKGRDVSEIYDEFLRNGGGSGTMTDLSPDGQLRRLYDSLESSGAYSKVWNVVNHPLEAAEIFSSRIVTADRLGVYMSYRGKGVPPERAAMAARTSTLDYSERGTSAFMSSWGRITAFMRADLLGLDQVISGVKDHPAQVARNVAAYIIIPAIALRAMNAFWDAHCANDEGEKYTEIPQWERDNYFITPPVMGQRIRIAVPHLPMLGVIKALPERFIDYMRTSDPDAFEGIVEHMTKHWVPPLIPDVAKPVLEGWTNKNFYTGKPLVPESLLKASGPMQYTEATSMVGRKLSQIIEPIADHLDAKVSPIVIDNYVKSWTGPVGMAALQAVDAVTKDHNAPFQLTDTPFLRSFLVRNPGANAASIQQFHSTMDEAQKLAADYVREKKLLRRGETTPEEFAEAASNMLNLGPARHAQKALSNMNDMIYAVNNRTDLTVDEKRQTTDTLTRNMILVARAQTQALREGMKALKDVR